MRSLIKIQFFWYLINVDPIIRNGISIRADIIKDIPENNRMVIVSLWNRPKKLSKGSFFYLFLLNLVQMYFIFSDNEHISCIFVVRQYNIPYTTVDYQHVTWQTDTNTSYTFINIDEPNLYYYFTMHEYDWSLYFYEINEIVLIRHRNRLCMHTGNLRYQKEGLGSNWQV